MPESPLTILKKKPIYFTKWPHKYTSQFQRHTHTVWSDTAVLLFSVGVSFLPPFPPARVGYWSLPLSLPSSSSPPPVSVLTPWWKEEEEEEEGGDFSTLLQLSVSSRGGKGEKRKIHFHYYCRWILLKWGAPRYKSNFGMHLLWPLFFASIVRYFRDRRRIRTVPKVGSLQSPPVPSFPGGGGFFKEAGNRKTRLAFCHMHNYSAQCTCSMRAQRKSPLGSRKKAAKCRAKKLKLFKRHKNYVWYVWFFFVLMWYEQLGKNMFILIACSSKKTRTVVNYRPGDGERQEKWLATLNDWRRRRAQPSPKGSWGPCWEKRSGGKSFSMLRLFF